MEGCKRLGTFRDHANLKYLDGCAEALTEHVWEICGKLAYGGAQRRCGDEITQEYDSPVFRLGLIRCSGIDDEIIHKECTTASWEEFAKAQEAKIAAWERIRVAANQDPNVVDKLSATVACLEESGHRDVDGLLFHWQHGLSPSEHKEREDRLTEAEKDLREQLHEPSRECAHREGLFAAQDAAWMTEVRRLQETEPLAVAQLVREGFLEALESSGELTFITGELPPHRNP